MSRRSPPGASPVSECRRFPCWEAVVLACPERVAGEVREDGREAPARSAGPRGAKRGGHVAPEARLSQ